MAFCVIIALQLRGRSIAEATGIDKIRQEERRRMAGNAVDKEERAKTSSSRRRVMARIPSAS